MKKDYLYGNKKRIQLTLLLLFFYTCNIFSKTTTNISQKTIKSGISIVNNTIITNPGTYKLDNNVENIEIDADNVTLDLNKYAVLSTTTAIKVNEYAQNIIITNGCIKADCDNKGNAGILIGKETNLIKIKNICIYGFEKGIFFDGLTTSTIIGDFCVSNLNFHCCTENIAFS